MVRITQDGNEFKVMFNNLPYTICATMEDAITEAKILRREIRVGK